MERIKIIQNMNKSYLVYTPKDAITVEHYEMRMLCENQIDGLLPCQIRPKDGVVEVYYDITSCMELQKRYETAEMNYKECKSILVQLAETQKRMETYMLEENRISLSEKHIFLEAGTGKYKFLFLPEISSKQRNGYQNMAEFMLEKVNHKDDQAVKLAYRFYKETRSSQFSMDCMIRHIEELELGNGSVQESAIEEEYRMKTYPGQIQDPGRMSMEVQNGKKPYEKDIWEESLQQMEKSKKEKKKKEGSHTKSFLCFSLALLCVLCYVKLPELGKEGYLLLLAGGILVGFGIGIMIYDKVKQKKLEKKKQKETASEKDRKEFYDPYTDYSQNKSMKPNEKAMYASNSNWEERENIQGKTVLLSRTSIV